MSKRRAWNYNQVTKECITCKKKFNVKNYRKDQALFCSRKCKWNYGLINKICEECDKNFIVNRAREEKHFKARFCSYVCYEKFKAKKRVIRYCKKCRRKIIVPLWNKDRGFCCKKCYTKYQLGKHNKKISKTLKKGYKSGRIIHWRKRRKKNRFIRIKRLRLNRKKVKK